MIKVGDTFKNRISGRIFKVTRLMRPKNKPKEVTHVEFNGGLLLPINKLHNFRFFEKAPEKKVEKKPKIKVLSKKTIKPVSVIYPCPHCTKEYKTKSGRTRHIKDKHK